MSTKTITVLSCDFCFNEITRENKARRPMIENIKTTHFVYNDVCGNCNRALISVIDKAIKEIRSAKQC